MRIAIIDDDLNVLEEVNRLLSEINDVEIVGQANSTLSGIKLIREANPDIVITDVQMPGGDGFEMIELLSDFPLKVIFMSGYTKNLIPSFRFQPLGFLFKPIVREELEEILSNFDSDLVKENPSYTQHQDVKIGIPTRQGFEYLPINDIKFIEADGSYSNIHLKSSDKPIMVSKWIKEFENALPNEKVMRVSRSAMVNVDMVKRFSRESGGTIELNDGKRFVIGKKYKDAFLNCLNQRNIKL